MQVCTLFLSINIKRHIQETHCESVIPEKLKKQKTLMDERKNGLTATHSIRPTAKGISNLKTRIDYECHHARSHEKFELSHPFVINDNQSIKQSLKKMFLTKLDSQF